MANEKALATISKARLALMEATTPEESQVVEALAAAGKAFAQENDFYEGVVEAERIYLEARRKTTELIRPTIVHGGHGKFAGERANNDVTSLLADYGFTDMQWSRRLAELKVRPDLFDSYFDTCIEMHAEPTTWGLLKYYHEKTSDPKAPAKVEKPLTILDRITDLIKEGRDIAHALSVSRNAGPTQENRERLLFGLREIAKDLEKQLEETK